MVFKKRSEKEKESSVEKRKAKRRVFGYYMPMMDEKTAKLVGHLSDISTIGFRLDSQDPLPVNEIFQLRLNLTPEVSEKSYMVFVACSKWCQADRFDPTIYNVGFEIVEIAPDDAEIYKQIIERYGSDEDQAHRGYLW